MVGVYKLSALLQRESAFLAYFAVEKKGDPEIVKKLVKSLKNSVPWDEIWHGRDSGDSNAPLLYSRFFLKSNDEKTLEEKVASAKYILAEYGWLDRNDRGQTTHY